jgi:intracellular septation protein A
MGVLGFAAAEFGPLIVFLALSAAVGMKAAIAGAVVATLLDAGWRIWRGRPFTRLYLVTTTLTLGFGAVDLWAATPFLIVYEAPLTNALTGAAFVVGAFGERLLMLDIAQARQPERLPETAEVRRFFRLFTLIWAAYFFLKAGGYVWLAAMLPMARAIALRSLLGGVSLAAMSVLSFTQGRRLFFLFRGWGWLGAPPEAGGYERS